MIAVDENFLDEQLKLLRSTGIRARKIGRELGPPGIDDDEIIPLLLRHRRTTLFTMDRDFGRRELCHSRYGIVFLEVDAKAAARFVVRVLRQPGLRTAADRMGKVVRASVSGLVVWRMQEATEQRVAWARRR